MNAKDLAKYPVHLGLNATAVQEPEFTGDMAWYEAYGKRHEADDIEGRLVSYHTFSGDWDMWEVHPNGHEIVLCTEGSMTLHQEGEDGHVTKVTLEAGQYAINGPGVWHTADVKDRAKAVFITAGKGTDHRPR